MNNNNNVIPSHLLEAFKQHMDGPQLQQLIEAVSQANNNNSNLDGANETNKGGTENISMFEQLLNQHYNQHRGGGASASNLMNTSGRGMLHQQQAKNMAENVDTGIVDPAIVDAVLPPNQQQPRGNPSLAAAREFIL